MGDKIAGESHKLSLNQSLTDNPHGLNKSRSESMSGTQLLMNKKFAPVFSPKEDLSIDACIAMICSYYGSPLNLNDVALLGEFPPGPRDLLMAFYVFEKFGFHCTPLEGELSELPTVPRPNLVKLKGESSGFAVLLDIDQQGVTLVDPLSALDTSGTSTLQSDSLGRKRMSLGQFSQIWAGEAIQIEPNPDELTQAAIWIRQSLNPVWKWRKRFGLLPPYAPKFQFLGALLALTGLNWFYFTGNNDQWTQWNPWISLPLSLMVALSYWHFLFSKSCSYCNQASHAEGKFPYSSVGIIYYGALLVLSLLPQAAPIVWLAILAAFGGHVHLVSVLLKGRIWCYPCLAIAGCSLFLAAYCFFHYPSLPLLVLGIGLSAVGGWSLFFGIRKYKIFRSDQRMTLSYQLAIKSLKELSQKNSDTDQIQILTFTRKGCMACVHFKRIVAPSLSAQFGDRIILIEEDAAHLEIGTPMFVIRGKTSVLIHGVGGPETLELLTQITQRVIDSNEKAEVLGLWVIGPETLNGKKDQSETETSGDRATLVPSKHH
jgi:hypothetical protein